ncbi:MAG: putative sulfate exporter family transporter [Nitrospira sp.]|nr:putative sulfate exporter family transporter [bacterium]MBL7048283.1 putative sulfate exporter family transporter [Nitrospira sp.]
MSNKQTPKEFLIHNWQGLFLAILLGISAYFFKLLTNSNMSNPLLAALIMGIIIRTSVKSSRKMAPAFAIAPQIFIPIGIFFYAVKNMNFVQFVDIQPGIIGILIVIMAVYILVISWLGRQMNQKDKITCLIAAGSAICGASAIAIVAPAIDAESEDISISLLAVALAAFVGLFIIFPFIAILFNLSGETYAIMSGSVLQFTGSVKSAIDNIPYLSSGLPKEELASLALSVKAFRYAGLLVVLPLFASINKRKFHIPGVLWVFFLAGLMGTWISVSNVEFYKNTLIPIVNPIYNISWSIAMAAVGLNVDARMLMSNNGSKALVMAFAGFFIATVFFLAAIFVIL